MNAAIEEAKKGLREGGIPIGSVLVRGGKIIAGGITCACKIMILWRMLKSCAWRMPGG